MKVLALVLVAVGMFSGCAGIGMQGGTGAGGRLVGTWERLELEAPQYRHIKLLSGGHFVWVIYDRTTGIVAAVGGGTYEFDGRTYIERLEFGSETLPPEIIGEGQFFTAELDGDEWRHEGTLSNGFGVREVWKRMD